MTELQKIFAEISSKQLNGLAINLQEEGWYNTATAGRNLIQKLTGFNGTTACLLVWEEQLHLFLDSRYYYAAKSLPVHVHKLKKDSFCQFILQNLPAEARIGIFTPSFSCQQAEKLKAACNKKKIKVVDCWLDSFPAPTQLEKQQLVSSPSAFTGSNSEKRLSSLRSWLVKQGIENYWLTDPASVSWLLHLRSKDYNYTPYPDCSCLISKHNCWLFYDGLVNQEVGYQLRQAGVSLVSSDQQERIFTSLAVRKVDLDLSMASAASCAFLTRHKIEWQHKSDYCQQVRAVKTLEEQVHMRLAALKDSCAFCHLLAWLQEKPLVSETQVAAKLEAIRCQIPGYHQPSFPTITASGVNSASPHYQTGEAAVAINKVLLVDAGGQYDGGTTDATRTVAFGEVSSSAIKEHFTQVLKAHINLALAVMPLNSKAKNLADLARVTLEKANLTCPHAIGHGVDAYGSVHAAPCIGEGSGEEIRAGTIITNEPGVYLAASHGLRSENMYLVIEENERLQLRALTFIPFDRNLIINELLQPEERAWLNSYHQQTYQVMRKTIVDSVTRSWLQSACAPL